MLTRETINNFYSYLVEIADYQNFEDELITDFPTHYTYFLKKRLVGTDFDIMYFTFPCVMYAIKKIQNVEMDKDLFKDVSYMHDLLMCLILHKDERCVGENELYHCWPTISEKLLLESFACFNSDDVLPRIREKEPKFIKHITEEVLYAYLEIIKLPFLFGKRSPIFMSTAKLLFKGNGTSLEQLELISDISSFIKDSPFEPVVPKTFDVAGEFDLWRKSNYGIDEDILGYYSAIMSILSYNDFEKQSIYLNLLEQATSDYWTIQSYVHMGIICLSYREQITHKKGYPLFPDFPTGVLWDVEDIFNEEIMNKQMITQHAAFTSKPLSVDDILKTDTLLLLSTSSPQKHKDQVEKLYNYFINKGFVDDTDKDNFLTLLGVQRNSNIDEKLHSIQWTGSPGTFAFVFFVLSGYNNKTFEEILITKGKTGSLSTADMAKRRYVQWSKLLNIFYVSKPNGDEYKTLSSNWIRDTSRIEKHERMELEGEIRKQVINHI